MISMIWTSWGQSHGYRTKMRGGWVRCYGQWCQKQRKGWGDTIIVVMLLHWWDDHGRSVQTTGAYCCSDNRYSDNRAVGLGLISVFGFRPPWMEAVMLKYLFPGSHHPSLCSYANSPIYGNVQLPLPLGYYKGCYKSFRPHWEILGINSLQWLKDNSFT